MQAGRQAGTDIQIGRQAGTDMQAGRQVGTDMQAGPQAGMRTDRMTGGETEWLAGRKTG